MKTAILIVAALLLIPGCSAYERHEECQAEICDGRDTDCDGFVDETRYECADGKMVEWCQCDGDNNFDCSQYPAELCRDSHCDDGTEPLCYMEPPVCAQDEILAHRDNCYLCVDPETCEPPGCVSGDERTHQCPDGSLVTWCRCDPEGVWDCVPVPATLCRDSSCDDGSQPMCDMNPPDCAEWEILAYQNSCYRCVNPETCIPWGTPECEFDYDCAVTEYCDECGTSSCPGCQDCLAACRPHDCPTEAEALCNMMRPDCQPGEVAVVRDACWVCVDFLSCEPETCLVGEEQPYSCPDGSEVPWCVCTSEGGWNCITTRVPVPRHKLRRWNPDPVRRTDSGLQPVRDPCVPGLLLLVRQLGHLQTLGSTRLRRRHPMRPGRALRPLWHLVLPHVRRLPAGLSTPRLPVGRGPDVLVCPPRIHRGDIGHLRWLLDLRLLGFLRTYRGKLLVQELQQE